MKQELDKIVNAIKTSDTPGADIRLSAHELSKTAINTFEGQLLISAMNMVAAIAQFAEDIGRLYNEPETGFKL